MGQQNTVNAQQITSLANIVFTRSSEITLQEFCDFFEDKLGSKKMLKRMFQSFDTDKDNVLNILEFFKAVDTLEFGSLEHRLQSKDQNFC